MTMRLALMLLAVAACTPSRLAPERMSSRVVDRLPMVDAVIDGQRVMLLLDTGASITCLHPVAATRVGRVAVGTSRLGGVGDTTRGVRTFGPATIEIGEFSASVASLHACPALPLAGRSALLIDGVLGADGLRGLTVVIDYPAGAVRLLDEWMHVKADSATVMPIVFAGTLPIITMELQVRDRWIPISLLLDTGADASLLLDAELADSLGVELEPHAAVVARGGLGGGISTRAAYVPRARLGSLEVRDPPVEVAASGLTQLHQHGVQGLVGSDFLRHFRIELDLGHARLLVEAPGPGQAVCGTSSGICLAQRRVRNGYVVQAVRPGSASARYGVVPGETIVRIGTADASRMNAAEARAALAPPNGLVMLWIANTLGRTRRVEFRVTQ